MSPTLLFTRMLAVPSLRSARWLAIGATCYLFAAGCDIGDIERDNQKPKGRVCKMTLISSQENTVFQLKGIDEKDWQSVGKGKIVYVQLYAGQAYEVAAEPDDYVRKQVTLPEPVRDLRFTFEISDRKNKDADVILELDVRVLSVASSQVLASANERINGLLDMRRAIEACTKHLVAKGVLDAKVAVVPFEEIGSADLVKYGETASSMMTSALAGNKATAVMERAQLKKILAERDLTWAAIASSPDKLGPVAGIQNLVVGTLSKVN